MDRIWFRSDSVVRDEEFVEDCRDKGIEVVFGLDAGAEGYGTLTVTDEPEVFKRNTECLVAVRNEEDMKLFDGAKYFVLDPQDNEPEYFLKIWQRFKGIPWTVAETERLIIRETVEDDLEELVRLYSEPTMTEFTEPLYETEAERDYIRAYREQVYEIQGFGIWSLIRKKDGKLIGRAGLVSRNDYDGVELGFAIGKEYRRQGYATEAVKECLDLADLMEFTRVRALVMPENFASKSLLNSLSFEFKGNELHHGDNYEIWETVLRTNT